MSPADQADALLDELKKESGGQLKIFLGAAPGVGKTYAMLNAARELGRQGVEVVVGVAETHGRRETEALLEGLEVLPRRSVAYKGREILEFDLDAALARRPAVLLVDELAHTNAPGSRHERRYQDIEELLDAGVSVYTTVNVQHLETLNDTVHQVTGVRVRETVPDSFFDRLREIVLVDLPARELIERLRQGKVYVPEQAASALQSFFSPSNLAALRELAMQTAADRVDSDLREYLVAHGMGPGAAIRRRVLVAVDGRDNTEYLVRSARRLAERRQSPWTVAYVDTGGAASARLQPTLDSAFELARRLGGETVTLRGPSVVDELVTYAAGRGVSTIVIGRTRERPLARAFNRTLTQQLLRKGAHFELTIVNTPYARARARRRLLAAERGDLRRWWGRRSDWAFATLVVGISVLTALAGERFADVRQPGLVFLTAVLLVAVRTRLAVAIYTAVLCFLAFDYFFTEPRHSFTMNQRGEIVAVLVFLLVALVSSKLADQLRSQVAALHAANARTRTLQALGERLAAAADEGEVLRAGAEELAAALRAEVVVLRRSGEAGELRPAVAIGQRAIEGNDLAAADWAASHAQEAGRGTDTLASADWWFVPLGSAGVVGVRVTADGRIAAEQRQLARGIVQNTALAAERTILVSDLESARVQGETERLRAALLASVSHDLRSPLASMIGAATSLSSYGAAMPETDRKALLDSILQEGGRLDRYIQNLLDMTRLGHGSFRLERDWVALEDVVAAAVGRLRKLFPAVQVDVDIPAQLRLLWIHPALIEQALFNILENAAKFSPSGSPVRLAAADVDDALIVDISDRGPGIPEAERRRIFDMFYSVARGDRGREGTGLGLAIVRGMIGAHGGTVEALAGADGAGTTIRVRLPFTEPAVKGR